MLRRSLLLGALPGLLAAETYGSAAPAWAASEGPQRVACPD